MPAAADDHELLVALIGPAAAALARSVPLAELLELAPGELTALGLPRRARVSVVAAAEVARRFQPAVWPPRPLECPRDVLAHLAELRRLPAEVLGVLMLDRHLNALGRLVRVAQGGAAQVSVQPRDVFVPAFQSGAAAVVIAHNHPSGVAEPSREDEVFTDQTVRAGRLLGVEVLDHIVVAKRSYFSFREAGLLDGCAGPEVAMAGERGLGFDRWVTGVSNLRGG